MHMFVGVDAWNEHTHLRIRTQSWHFVSHFSWRVHVVCQFKVLECTVTATELALFGEQNAHRRATIAHAHYAGLYSHDGQTTQVEWGVP